MTLVGTLLRPPEIALVSSADLRTVNRAIDERILPEGLFEAGGGRRIWAGASALIAFYHDASDELTSGARLMVIRKIGMTMRGAAKMDIRALLDETWLGAEGRFFHIDLRPYLRASIAGLERLAAAKALAERNPEILGGTPVIRGTRVPVHDVAASIAAGISTSRILEAYPTLSAEQVELSAFYAAATPLRGRPRGQGTLPSQAVVLEHRQVPRRSAS